MTVGHFLTNKGKLRLLQGAWNTAGNMDIRVGLIASPQPVGLDTAAEIADLNYVSELLALCTEAYFSTGVSTSYTRKNLLRSNAVEDDTNDYISLDADSVVWEFAGFGYPTGTQNTLYGAFFYDATGSSVDTTHLLLSIDWFYAPIITTGGNITYAINNLYLVF